MGEINHNLLEIVEYVIISIYIIIFSENSQYYKNLTVFLNVLYIDHTYLKYCYI